MPNDDFWYRYEDMRDADNNVRVFLRRFTVEKETEKGVWLYNLPRRFVLRSARKRYACPTIEEARVSFEARKRRQIKLLSAQLKSAEMALEAIQDSKYVEQTYRFLSEWT